MTGSEQIEVRMTTGISGGRADGRPWPLVGNTILVSPEEGADLISGGMAVPVDKDESRTETRPAAETRTETRGGYPDEPTPGGKKLTVKSGPTAANSSVAKPGADDHEAPELTDGGSRQLAAQAGQAAAVARAGGAAPRTAPRGPAGGEPQ